MIRVCKLDRDGVSYPEVTDDPMAWHDLLGGYMESFPLPHHLARRGLMALADEDGLGKQLALNPYTPLLGRTIVGPVVIARSDPPEFVDLTAEDVAALDNYFGRLAIVFTIDFQSTFNGHH